MPIVKFTKENKEIEVPRGANLRKEAIKAGINVHQGINGTGAGLNRVLIQIAYAVGRLPARQSAATQQSTKRVQVRFPLQFLHPLRGR